MRTKTVLLACAAFMLCGASWVFAAEGAPKIYFTESFRNYADKAPGISGKGMTIGNDPIWADAADLNVRAQEDGFVFDQFIPAPKLDKFDFLFHFRFLNTAAQKEGTPAVAGTFDIVFKNAAGKDTVITFVHTVTADGTNSMTVSVAGQKGETPAVANWKWEEAVVQADGKSLAVYVSRDRALQKLVSAPFSGAVTGVNFKATKDRHFAIRNIVLRDSASLPSHPVEKHFADFRSRTQPIANPMTATPGQTVTLTPKPYAGIVLKLGTDAANAAEMKVAWDNGKSTTFPIGVDKYVTDAVVPVVGRKKGAKLELPDATISMKPLRQFVRPNLKMFQSGYDAEPQYIDIVREWDKLPKASEHPFDIEFVAQPDGGLQLFFDGSYVQTLKETNAVAKEVAFKFAAPVQYRVKADRSAQYDANTFCVIDLSENPRAKAFADASLSLKPGIQAIGGIPFDVAKPLDSADVGICKQGKGNWGLEVEEYHGRSPLDGFPSAIHYRLPAAPYGKAYVLLALDPDPAKVKVLTTRVGHYINNGSGGNMLADNVIEITGDKVPDNFKPVGEVTLKGQKLPLYMVEIPLALGDILDVPARRGYVDFEFTGKGWLNTEQLDNRMKPDPYLDSAFNIFAVTIEKAPVLMDVKESQPGNVFTEDEQDPKTTVTLKATQAGAKGAVAWSAIGTDGKEVFKGTQGFSLAKIGDATAIDIPFGKTEVGFYDLAIRILDAKGGTLITHPARFAILGKDTRQANKNESPYATWWFNSHGSPGDMDLGGPIMQKAGIRKASWNVPTPEAQAKYNTRGCGNIMCPGMRDFDKTTGKFKPETITSPDPNDPKKKIKTELSGDESFKRKIKEALVKDPLADHILIWHESGPGYGIPEELLNMDVPALPDGDKGLAAYINEAGRLIREVAPQLKIQIGNSSASIGAVTRPLRAGADPQYYDYIGIETPSQVIYPEKLQEVGLQGMVVSKEIANKLAKGKKNVKLNGTWEFTYRCERDMGEQQQAEWYMRDVLISLANDFFLISPGILFDCSSGYYNTLWGGSGILQRGPYVYPKRAYVAYAALTRALDRVKFSRQIPTGSTSVYAIEFARADGKFATALWASRGAVKFALDVPSGKASVTEMYGKTYTLDGNKPTVDGGTSPLYVVTDKPLAAVTIAGRSFPKDMALAQKAKVGPAFDDVSKVELKPDMSMESTHTGFLPILKPSEFTVQQVTDEEKGACVEVSLDVSKDKYKSKYITEYTTLRLKEPVLIPGKPEVVGVWVKGNSNGGQIRFEIEDANGEVFKNLSTGREWGCDIMDWPGNLAVNFDGWGYVYQTLFPTTLVNDHSPGPYSEQWVSEGGDKKIDLPIKIRAITVGMYRTKLDLLDFKPSVPSIRIRDAGGIEK